VLRRSLVPVLLAVACALAGLGGMVLALRASGPVVRPFALGTVELRAGLSADGRLDAYVPFVDWGARAHPFGRPLGVDLEFRSLDRDAALAAARSGRAADANIEAAKGELRSAVDAALLRAAVAALVGGVVGGFVAGAVIVAAGRRRRWLLAGTLSGLVTSLALVALAGVSLARANWSDLRQPTFYAHGTELPELLSFSEQILTAGEDYTQSYDRAVAGLTGLLSAGQTDRPPAPAKTIALASDLHSNTLVLPVLSEYTRGHPLFFAGDFTELGTRWEEGVVPAIAGLGDPVVAVSGNHDSAPLMRALRRAGVVVLDRRSGVIDVDGIAVAGFDDPLEGGTGIAGRRLQLHAEERGVAVRSVLAWFDALPRRPDVVMIHQHALARALLEHVASSSPAPLLILTGHDHRQHIDQKGTAVLVDGGTVGAGGPFAVGQSQAGFAILHLTAGNRIQSVDLVQAEPFSGEGSARRVVFDVGASLGE
jgi:predicted phosphodiesterase